MNESFINFIESKLVEVNDRIQILSDYVEKIKKKLPDDIRKMSFEDLLKTKICKSFKYDICSIVLYDKGFDTWSKRYISFDSDDGMLCYVHVCNLKDKYGYVFEGVYNNDGYKINKYCDSYTCLLNSIEDKEFRKFLLDNNLGMNQKECICVRGKDYYVLEDCDCNKRQIFETIITVDGAKYSRYISKVKISKNGDIELID